MRIVVIFFVWACFLISPAIADRLVWDEGKTTRYFPGAPASELLSAADFTKYRKYLEEENCHDALILLNEAFVARYPQFPKAAHDLSKYGFSGHIAFQDWITFIVPRKYPVLNFCRLKKKIHKVEQEIKEKGIIVGLFYPGKPFKRPHNYAYPSLWMKRDVAVSLITYMAYEDYRPAIIFLTDLVRRGGIFRQGADPEMEYFLFQRTCHLGHSCDGLIDRLRELEKKIPTDRVAELKANSKQEQTAHDLIYRYVFKRKNL